MALVALAIVSAPTAASAAQSGAVSTDTVRALQSYEVMQRNFYVPGTGLYEGDPGYSFLWPFSQALAATVSLAKIPGERAKLEPRLHALLIGLQQYLGPAVSVGEPVALGASTTTTLRSYDGNVAPPVGPGGASFYDDNEWVGIELMRLYELDHEPAVLRQAEQIMAFVMAGWQVSGPAGQTLACPGGVPFSNGAQSTERNTVTNGPGAELALQLYRVTHVAAYLQFAQMAYEWVRGCLLEANGLYADHIDVDGSKGTIEWSYNQGSMIGAGVLLYQATGDGAYLYQARQTAAAALAYYTPGRLASENPFFVAVYFRNLMYLDSVTHDPPGAKLAQTYADYAWRHHRLVDGLFAFGSPPAEELLVQAALVQVYALLSIPPGAYF
jgi:hypothetical protein